MGWFTHIVHAIAKIFTVGAMAAASVTHTPLATGSVSAGMQDGPACIASTMQPGTSASTTVNVVNPANGWERIGMSVQNIGGPAAAVGHPISPSWVSFSGAGWVASEHTATVTVTVNVPGNARHGVYGGQVVATAERGNTFLTPAGGSLLNVKRVNVGLGAAAATDLEFAVDAPAPRHAFCDGHDRYYYPAGPQLPWCKPGQAVAIRCQEKPPMPPVANARNCHVSKAAWAAYMRQLALGGHQRDAHCTVNGHILNLRWFYLQSGQYQDNGQTGPVSSARTW